MIEPEHVDAVHQEWGAALADAGYERQAFRLYAFQGEESPGGNRAYYFSPGQRLQLDANFPDELVGQVQDANEHLEHHRIAVWTDAPTPVLGAKLRHELEHARQWDTYGQPIYDLNDLILAVLSERVGGLPGAGSSTT